MQDYYAILGIDAGASPDTLKVAYRRLARKYHPDLKGNCSTEEKVLVETRMAELNEAYATLSNTKSRREYDERMRLECLLTTKSGGKSASGSRPASPSVTSADHRASRGSGSPGRPQQDVSSQVVNQFSGHLRERFLSQKSGFAWQQTRFEGFDWGLKTLNWFSHYSIAVRAFSALDPATIRKFVTYSETLIKRSKQPLKSNYFVFLLPFSQLSEWESVSNHINSFLNGKGPAGISASGVSVILLDMHHSRIVRMGSRFADKKFELLLQSIRTAG